MYGSSSDGTILPSGPLGHQQGRPVRMPDDAVDDFVWERAMVFPSPEVRAAKPAASHETDRQHAGDLYVPALNTNDEPSKEWNP